MQKGSVNKVVIVGHIGADPETRFTPSGTAVANFNVATNESRKNPDGGYQDHTEWHSCVLFGKRAEFAGEYLKRGVTALEAAGIIHTDFQRGFIKAEVYKYADLNRLGSEKAVRDRGLVNMEGKQYVVEEGDCIYFRFNV